MNELFIYLISYRTNAKRQTAQKRGRDYSPTEDPTSLTRNFFSNDVYLICDKAAAVHAMKAHGEVEVLLHTSLSTT
jgi:hypothetical protein